MTRDVMKLKRARNEVFDAAESLLSLAESREGRDFTAEEETRYSAFMADIKKRDAEILRVEEHNALDARRSRGNGGDGGGTGPQGPETGDGDEFRSFGEWLKEVRFKPDSNRLMERAVSMGNKDAVGYMVPEQFDFTLRQVSDQEAVFRPRATVIPAGDPPDAVYNVVSLDQTGSRGVYSGVTLHWVGETDPRPAAGDPAVKTIELKPNLLTGYIDVTDKLLQNSEASGEMISTLLRRAIISAEEKAFISGAGSGKPKGIIGNAASIVVDRTAANKIGYDDLVNMEASKLAGGKYAWIANSTILPQLRKMTDPSGQYIWQQNAAVGSPATLLGLPLVENGRSPVLGTEGDLVLVDLTYYLIKDGTSASIFIDPYTQKINGLTRVFVFWNVDGKPWLTAPMLQEDGATLVSPFVVLG